MKEFQGLDKHYHFDTGVSASYTLDADSIRNKYITVIARPADGTSTLNLDSIIISLKCGTSEINLAEIVDYRHEDSREAVTVFQIPFPIQQGITITGMNVDGAADVGDISVYGGNP
jgi:hypothetical protein